MPRPDELAARLRAAARAQDLEALHALVDWDATGAGALARALDDVDPADRAAVAARGLEEIDRSTADPDLVRSRLGDLLRTIASGELVIEGDRLLVRRPGREDLPLAIAAGGERVVLPG